MPPELGKRLLNSTLLVFVEFDRIVFNIVFHTQKVALNWGFVIFPQRWQNASDI